MNVDLGVCMASRHSVGAHAAPLCPVCACVYHVVGHDAHCARKTTWLNMPKAQKKPVPVARNAEEKSRAVAAAMKSQGTKDAAMKKNKRAAKKDAVMKKDRSAAKKKNRSGKSNWQRFNELRRQKKDDNKPRDAETQTPNWVRDICIWPDEFEEDS